MQGATESEDDYNYGYIIFLLIVIVSWGVVPGFAKSSNLPGDTTTFWVNWAGFAAVALLITIQGKWKLLSHYCFRDYCIMVSLGLVWPLAYSITYFQCIQTGGPALAVILNYTWPVFCMLFSLVVCKKKISWTSAIPVGLAIIAVGLTYFFEYYQSNTKPIPTTFLLGIAAAGAQGFYSAATDRWRYNAWIMTFVVELVTVVGISLLVFFRQSFVLSPSKSIFYLAVVGIIGNGIGFWAFLAGSQKSSQFGMKTKSSWLIGMCLVPFSQVLFLPLIKAESVSVWKWIGVALITISFLFHKVGCCFLSHSKT